MKKQLMLVVLCLCLASCGTFDVKVQILPTTTAIAPITATVLPTQVAPKPTATTRPTVEATPQPADPAITLANIQMNDAGEGWAVTSSGRIVRTGNGGDIWQDITPSNGTFDQHGLFALNDTVAWAVSTQFESNNVVWITQDRGSSWQPSAPLPVGAGSYNPLRLQFPDEKHGWLLASMQEHLVLYKSDDSGKSWMQISSIEAQMADAYLSANASMAFFNGQQGWLGGAWEQNEWRTLKTSDGGSIWGTDTFRLPQQKNIQCNGQAISEIPPGSMAVEVHCTNPKDAKYLFHRVYYLSQNTGTEWHSWTLSGDLINIYFLNASQGWMMVTSNQSQLNKILQTRDAGKTWKTVSLVEWQQARFNFVTDKIGWAIVGDGPEAALFRTEDGGKTWVQVRPFVSP